MRGLASSVSLIVLAGCPAGDPMSGTTTSESSTGTTAGPGASSTSDTVGASSSVDTSSGPGATGTTSATASASDTGLATDSGAGGTLPCGFEGTLCSLAEGKTPTTDCGIVLLDDDAATWEAASMCAVEAVASQEGFKVAFQMPSIDSIVFDGYFGSVGLTYATGRLYMDTLGGPQVIAYHCGDVAPMAGCTPDVGTHCLECVDQDEGAGGECVR